MESKRIGYSGECCDLKPGTFSEEPKRATNQTAQAESFFSNRRFIMQDEQEPNTLDFQDDDEEEFQEPNTEAVQEPNTRAFQEPNTK